MSPSHFYIAISIVILASIAFLVLVVRKNKKEKKLSPLAGLAFGFVLAGLFFGEARLMGYSLLGIGMVLAIIDIIKKTRGIE
jgi:predicted branched-subunit amino acid permease